MRSAPTCSRCGRELPPVWMEAACPRCLLALGILTPTLSPEPTLSGDGDSRAVRGLRPPLQPDTVVRGEELGRFVDLGGLGRGGMGEVRRVYDPLLERTVAMKIIRVELSLRPELMKRFIQESLLTAALQHPGIVPVHETGVLGDGRHYFVMKEVKGETLKECLDRAADALGAPGSEPDPGEASAAGTGDSAHLRRLLHALLRVAETVAFAHAKGVLHCDLKPSNIMLGEFGEVLVLDWGIAMSFDRQCSDSPTTERVAGRPGADGSEPAMGTRAYMAPEQAAGPRRSLTPAADVFSLGRILQEMLARLCPEIETLASMGSEGDRGLFSGAGALDRLHMLGRRACAAEPSERPADGGIFARELSDWLDGAQRRVRGEALVRASDRLPAEVAALRQEAHILRREAAQLLQRLRPGDPTESKLPAWQAQDQASRLEAEAELLELRYIQNLHAALSHDPSFVGAHRRLAAHYHARHVAAEQRGDLSAAAQAELLLRSHDLRADYRTYLEGQARLSLQTLPSGATVTLERYSVHQRRRLAQAMRRLGETPLCNLPLERGQYLLRISAQGFSEVLFPLHLERLQHQTGTPPGLGNPVPVALPRLEELGPDDMYVPGGWSRFGGDSDAWNGLPAGTCWVDGFIMRRHPVTNTEYIEFLDDLIRRDREAEALSYVPREKAGGLGEQGQALYGRNPNGTFTLRTDGEGEIWQPRWPVVMVSWYAARAFAAWEAERSGLPWRLPLELEWEKAARGPAGWIFPWGDSGDPTWACWLDSRSDRPSIASVDEYPTDVSPYDIRGLGGNVRDWCLDPFTRDGPVGDGERLTLPPVNGAAGEFRVSRGGSWNAPERAARCATRYRSLPEIRSAVVGFRLVRSWPDPPPGLPSLEPAP